MALALGLNANLVHKWRRRVGDAKLSITALKMTTFIPMTTSPAVALVRDDIRIEWPRGASALSVTWPLAASTQCSGWLRELLK